MIGDAVRSGDRLAALVALRDDLAATWDASPSARDRAALAARLVDVLGLIADLSADHRPGETRLSDFERRLAERQAPAARPRRPAGG